MLDWNDLRWFVAVADAGSFRKAATPTGLNHTTLSRRIRALEEELGLTLFERAPTGLTVTEAGEELRRSCTTLIEGVADLQRRLAGKDQRAAGRVSLTYAASVAPHVLDAMGSFGKLYPDISIVHVNSEEFVDLGGRVADVAVRAVTSPNESLHGRRVGKIRWGVYGARSRYPEVPDTFVPSEHDWIGMGGRWAKAPPSVWLREHVPASHIRADVDDPQSVRELTAAGLGVGLLMALDGDRDPRLVHLGAWHGPSPPAYLWLLLHPDVGRARRVRVVADYLFDHLRGLDDVFVKDG